MPSDAERTGTIMDGTESIAALMDWAHAISSFIGEPFPSEESLRERAIRRGVSHPRHIDAVAEWFDWDAITAFLEEQSNAD